MYYVQCLKKAKGEGNRLVVIRGLAVLGWKDAFTWTAGWAQAVESPQVTVDPTAASEPSLEPPAKRPTRVKA